MRASYFSAMLLLVLLAGIWLPAVSQVSVTGPTCVIPRTTYQYVIGGVWDSASTMQICLTGGVFAGSDSVCLPGGRPRPFVLVTWKEGGRGSLRINSSKGSGTISVSLTDTLTGGAILDTSKAQRIGYLAIPSLILCSPSTGGSCSPAYTYQWEQSPDLVEWSAIAGATGQNLLLTRQLTQTTFVRRKVTETSSNTIAYSDTALVDVGAPAPAAAAL